MPKLRELALVVYTNKGKDAQARSIRLLNQQLRALGPIGDAEQRVKSHLFGRQRHEDSTSRDSTASLPNTAPLVSEGNSRGQMSLLPVLED